MLIIDIIIAMLVIYRISMACLGLYGWRFAGRIPAGGIKRGRRLSASSSFPDS
jgi:hypothetical protein